MANSLLLVKTDNATFAVIVPYLILAVAVAEAPPGAARLVVRAAEDADHPPIFQGRVGKGTGGEGNVQVIPAIAEAGVPGYESMQWYGVLAPAATPREIITMLNREMVAILRVPDTMERLMSDGSEIVAGTPEEFGALIKSEAEKWANVLKTAGLKPE